MLEIEFHASAGRRLASAEQLHLDAENLPSTVLVYLQSLIEPPVRSRSDSRSRRAGLASESRLVGRGINWSEAFRGNSSDT